MGHPPNKSINADPRARAFSMFIKRERKRKGSPIKYKLTLTPFTPFIPQNESVLGNLKETTTVSGSVPDSN